MESEPERIWFESADDEPEFVGAFEEPVTEECQHWIQRDGEHVRCCEETTHTVVMRTHKTVELASCDDHGSPDLAGKSVYYKTESSVPDLDTADKEEIDGD